MFKISLEMIVYSLGFSVKRVFNTSTIKSIFTLFASFQIPEPRKNA